jgi:hypothetical protein
MTDKQNVPALKSDNEKKSVASLKGGSKISPIIPETLEDVYRMAKCVAASGLAPRGMDTAEKLTVALLHGLEIGLPPMTAIQKIAVVNGRPTIWGDAIPAILWSKGFKIKEWNEGGTAFCTVTRPDGTEVTRSFSVADAQAARLLDKDGPWKNYRGRMLQMRARAFAARDGAADVLGGLYVKEEIEDEPSRGSHNPYDGGKLLEVPEVIEQVSAAVPAAVPSAVSVPQEHKNHQEDEQAKAEELLEHLDDALGSAVNEDDLNEAWEIISDEVEELSKDYRGRAYSCYNKHLDRVRNA